MALARRWTRRLLRASLYALVAILLLSAVLRIATYVYRLRAEHLMADLQSLQLRHSTWPEAQRLITRWGRYGHYDGTCDASFCRYIITLESPISKAEGAYFKHRKSDVGLSVAQFAFLNCERLGGRVALLRASFVVQDQVVLRKGVIFTYSVVLPDLPDNSPYMLIASSHTANHVLSDERLPSSVDRLSHHPFYVATKPSGCEGCMEAFASFAPDTPDPQVRNLTTFDLSCLTRFRPCRFIEDVYPAAEEWHLYDGTTGAHPETASTPHWDDPVPLNCDVPLFARGREALQILSVTSIAEKQGTYEGDLYERGIVRLDSILKGTSDHIPGETFKVEVVAEPRTRPVQIETPLEPGKRFLLLSFARDVTRDYQRCSVIPDTPDARAKLQQGLAQNATLRHPDPRPDWYIAE